MDKTSSYLTSLATAIGTDTTTLEELSVIEVNLSESLLTPGLQTQVIVQARLNGPTPRDINQFYDKSISIVAERPILAEYGLKSKFATNQKIYRVSNRTRISYEVEQFEINACNPTLIEDAKIWVSKSWKAATPSTVVSDMFTQCLSPQNYVVESSGTPRDYIAENIHPFQVIQQQAEVALTTSAMDPSFVHFMTYQNEAGDDIPTHNFRSLTSMASATPIFEFTYSAKAAADLNYANPGDVMSMSFPCDFDLLSDVLNGYDESGNPIFSLITWNPYNATASIYGRGLTRCGGTSASSITNMGTASDQSTTNTNVEEYLLKRKPRMALLDQDKVALRLTVAFNPNLNVGKVISLKLPHPTETNQFLYGTGEYLISALTHNIKMGGLGTTVIDCVAETVAAGFV